MTNTSIDLGDVTDHPPIIALRLAIGHHKQRGGTGAEGIGLATGRGPWYDVQHERFLKSAEKQVEDCILGSAGNRTPMAVTVRGTADFGKVTATEAQEGSNAEKVEAMLMENRSDPFCAPWI